MVIKSVPVHRIKPAAYNPRKSLAPGEPEFEKLRRSLGEFGLVEPLVWNKRTGNLVGGHQRFAVLMAEGAKTVEVSVVDASGMPSDPELLGHLDSALYETLVVVGGNTMFDASVVSNSLPHVSLSAANNRLAALESKGVLKSTRRGRSRMYRPVVEGLRYGR